MSFSSFVDAAHAKQTARVGKQSPLPQARIALAPQQTAVRLQLDDGVRAANRIHTENANLSAGLGGPRNTALLLRSISLALWGGDPRRCV